MDHCSSSGGQKRSQCSSHLDFVSYWADRTIDEAVLRGQQLCQEKIHSLPRREQYALNIDIIKTPVLKECHRRKKSTVKFYKKLKSRSRAKSPMRSIKEKKRKKLQKTKGKAPCGMRTAELALPTKRHCLDTWKNKFNVLPSFMIERLRHQVMDQRPVVPISDAIYCFKRKCKRRNKAEKIKTPDRNKKIKKLLRANELKTLSAVFGHRIAIKLNTPLNIILNSDLEKMANVVSCDIAELMCKSNNIDMNNKVNKAIHRDITKKVTIWVSGILDESTNKILDDQIREFEAEAGLVLDFIDDLVDDVLDICGPKPEVFEECSSCESEVSMDRLDKACSEENLSEPHISIEKEILESASLTDVGSENIEKYFRNVVKTIINDIDRDTDTKSNEYLDFDVQSSEDIETKDTNQINDEYLEYEGVSSERSDNIKETDTDVNDYPYLEIENDVVNGESSENGKAIDANVKNDLYLETEDGVFLQPTEDAEEKDTNTDRTENPKTDDRAQQNELLEISLEDIDTINQFAAVTGDNKEGENPRDEQMDKTDKISATSSEENNKKVTFNEMVNNAAKAVQKSEVKGLDWKASVDRMDFAEPNEDLLSDADESWPGESQPPILRPSQSVSKSITSLGKINEDEEKTSIRTEETTKSVKIEAQKISGTLHIETATENEASADEFEQHVKKGKDYFEKESVEGFVKTKEKAASKESENNPSKDSKTIVSEDLKRVASQEIEKTASKESKKIASKGFIRTASQKSELSASNEAEATAPKGFRRKASEESEVIVSKELENSDSKESKKIPSKELAKTGSKEPEKLTSKDLERSALVKIEKIASKKSERTTSKASERTAFKDSEKSKSQRKESRISISKKVKPPKTKQAQIEKSKKHIVSNKSETSQGLKKNISKTKNKIEEKTSTQQISKEKSKDIESGRVSQSSITLGKSRVTVSKAKDDKISSLMVKPKLNFRVNINTAPAWINRNFGKSSCRCIIVKVSSKSKIISKTRENEVRMWCRDLEQGYENLNLWSKWIDNTSRTVCLLQREMHSFNSSKRCRNKEWMKLKRNVDKDAYLWRKLIQNTQEQLNWSKNICQK